MDILGAGLGLGAANLSSVYMPVTVGLCQILFLYIGLFIGSKIGGISDKYQTVTGILPGLIMILIALCRFF
jgi:putative Mn2+ efflux pump MntP